MLFHLSFHHFDSMWAKKKMFEALWFFTYYYLRTGYVLKAYFKIKLALAPVAALDHRLFNPL